LIRAVLDTNVFVSAFLLSGRLNRLADLVLRGAFTWLISGEILEEYADVIARPMYRLSSDELTALLYQVKERAVWIETASSFAVVKLDPADDKFLACAVDGRADWIVSGDRHLLGLKEFRGIRIGPPSEFLALLR
jgi:putative PIN family toxin of toxin-antitoxin system